MISKATIRNLLFAIFFTSSLLADDALSIAPFNVDATPPLGAPIAYTLAERIDDPLSARGIVIMTHEKPIVLCAVDWIGIDNGGHDVWRETLARAAGTSVDRVAVHTLHQHDGARCDFAAEALLAERGLGGKMFDVAFTRKTIQSVAAAIRESMKQPRRVTHLGAGKAKVDKVASNRRILGPDGKVKLVRFSSCRNQEAINAPEGTIDPYVRLVSFWDGETPVASLTYYATHPMSYYRQGGVSADFVGLARAEREKERPGVAHVHFTGACGNVAAGKYNDGSHAMRAVLTQRMAAGMRAAWNNMSKMPIRARDVRWSVKKVALPLNEGADEKALLEILDDPTADVARRIYAASEIVYIRRMAAGHVFDIACLRLGSVAILHTPGELFVEYQLAAQAVRPGEMVCMAAYGDYGPGYIGTAISYSQGGYETKPSSSMTSPAVEAILLKAMRELLK